jgi:hypothetical protein
MGLKLLALFARIPINKLAIIEDDSLLILDRLISEGSTLKHLIKNS